MGISAGQKQIRINLAQRSIQRRWPHFAASAKLLFARPHLRIRGDSSGLLVVTAAIFVFIGLDRETGPQIATP
jgi:hypothetical protein